MNPNAWFRFKVTFSSAEIDKHSFDITKFKEFNYDEILEVRYMIDLGRFKKY